MDRLEFAVTIAKEAGTFTLDYFDKPDLAIERKGDGTPVTMADKGAERLLRERIEREFPDDAILGEEFPDRAGKSGFKWILDPIDGTKSFIHGVPFYSTLIGVEWNGQSQIGVIWLPALKRGVWAETGKGVFEETPNESSPIPARVSKVETLENALFLTSEVKTFKETGRFEAYNLMEDRCRLSRTWGDAYGYYLVATGRADVMIDPEMSPWDAGPLLPILNEAGGVFSDWTGESTIYGGDGIATNPSLFDEVLPLIRPFPNKKALPE